MTFSLGSSSLEDCPANKRDPHRGPEGPNEDLAQCFFCLSPTFAMRPWGETYGRHLDDCSLPIWHKSYCVGGGSGHPTAEVRGYFPPEGECAHNEDWRSCAVGCKGPLE